MHVYTHTHTVADQILIEGSRTYPHPPPQLFWVVYSWESYYELSPRIYFILFYF